MEKLFQITFQVLFCLCLSHQLVATDNFAEFIDQANDLRQKDPQKALNIIDEKLANGELTDDERGELFYLKGLVYKQGLADQENALKQFYNALKYFRDSENPDQEYRSLFYLAQGYENLFRYDYAIDYLHEALAVKGLSEKRERVVQYNLARVLKLAKEYEESKRILTELSEFYEQRDHKWLMLSKAELALTYLQNKEFESSTLLYHEVLELVAVHGDYAGLESKAINSLGFIKLKQQKLEDAEAYLVKGLALKEGSTDQQSLLMSYLNLGELYQALGASEQAIAYFERGIALDESAVNHQSMIEALNELSAMAEAEQDLRAALDYQMRIGAIQQPYVELSERLKIMHDQYKAERVKFFHDKLMLQAELLETKNRSLLGLWVFVGVLLIAVGVLRWQSTRLRADNDVIAWLRRDSKLLHFLKTRYQIDLEQAEQDMDRRYGSVRE